MIDNLWPAVGALIICIDGGGTLISLEPDTVVERVWFGPEPRVEQVQGMDAPPHMDGGWGREGHANARLLPAFAGHQPQRFPAQCDCVLRVLCVI